jgi:hypothetical protein
MLPAKDTRGNRCVAWPGVAVCLFGMIGSGDSPNVVGVLKNESEAKMGRSSTESLAIERSSTSQASSLPRTDVPVQKDPPLGRINYLTDKYYQLSAL